MLQSSALAQPIIVSPPPLVISSPGEAQPVIVRFVPRDPQCGGVGQPPVAKEEPLPVGLVRPSNVTPDNALPEAVRLTFEINSDGRPVSVRSAPDQKVSYWLNVEDVAPALSTWRFASGAKVQKCEITFDVHAEPVSKAPLPAIYRYLALQRPGSPGFNISVGKAAFERAKPSNSNCFAERSNVREQHHPAFEEIPQPPGTVSHSFLSFDIGSDGTVNDVRTVNSDGNKALDAQSRAALSKWRFEPGAKTGCIHSYYRKGNEPLPAPEPKPLSAYAPRNSACKNEPEWLDLPRLSYPPAFNRRLVEGWAVIGYDIAPWGASGNIRVLASQPAEQFGVQAANIVTRAKKAPGSKGYTGCVQLIRFKIEEAGQGT